MTPLAFLLWLLLGSSGLLYNPFTSDPSTWTRPNVRGDSTGVSRR